MHMVLTNGTRSNPLEARSVTLYDEHVPPQKIIQSLAIWIHYKLSYCTQADAASTKTRINAGIIARARG